MLTSTRESILDANPRLRRVGLEELAPKLTFPDKTHGGATQPSGWVLPPRSLMNADERQPYQATGPPAAVDLLLLLIA